MYQALLTRRYLFSKIMPLLASAAVMLCTAMVIVVWSVMGGFLVMLLNSGKSMIGDVSITWPVQGIPHYQDLVARLEADPAVDAATPTIETLGLLGLPSTDLKPVTVVGVEPEGYHRVTGYRDRLWWRPLEEPLARDAERADPRLESPEMAGWLEDGARLAESDGSAGLRPAVALGIQVTEYNNERTPEGFFRTRYYDMPEREVTLSVLPLSRRGVAIEAAARRFPVANEFHSGLYQVDAEWVVVPLESLQQMLRMDSARKLDPVDDVPRIERDPETGREVLIPPEGGELSPARATTVLVKAAPGVAAAALRDRCKEIYAEFRALHKDAPPAEQHGLIFTWEEKPGLKVFISAVKKETSLVLVLFSFISITAVFLIFAIFWSMISEKTRDIGVLRAVGASRAGVAWLFVRYGLVIGIVGSLAGAALAFVIVTNINPIHEWLGSALGLWVWDPRVYYFDVIPNKVDPVRAGIVVCSGIASSALGALIPALRAAFMDPVRALRFE
ncbi:MAG: FtsX-like permease family protein [Planctomycetota bacterium]|nr:FtsX-like permease family protein [Planctomycetota bacterium]